ncbi:hypothetical protein [Filimonas effusa]|uniref:Uncharacterized protein n=1 Tax=Filimonas effusa TaxID=2508721 RepID=A0A4Q1DAN3_9BACT|nr:hypothetical protein [Filimonas effusa]RXK86472.1 hypothetical protein ESB13_06600 [Filimonas effusa]
MRIQNNGSLLKGGKAKLSATNAMLILIAAFSVFAASCSKNKEVQSPGLTLNNGLGVIVGSTPQAITGSGVTSGTIYNTSGLYQVDTFRQAYSTSPGQPADGNFYWIFTDNEAGTSTTFDIKFTGTATGDITAPTGFGAPVLKYIDKSFTSVVADDFDDALDPDNNTIGMNEVVGDNVPPPVAAFANGKGWYKYMWNNHTIQPVAGRTLLWQKGAVIFKFEIQSIYKGTLFPYYTFRYQQIAS